MMTAASAATHQVAAGVYFFLDGIISVNRQQFVWTVESSFFNTLSGTVLGSVKDVYCTHVPCGQRVKGRFNSSYKLLKQRHPQSMTFSQVYRTQKCTVQMLIISLLKVYDTAAQQTQHRQWVSHVITVLCNNISEKHIMAVVMFAHYGEKLVTVNDA